MRFGAIANSAKGGGPQIGLSCGATSINALVCNRFCVCVTDFPHDIWTSSNTCSTTSCPYRACVKSIHTHYNFFHRPWCFCSKLSLTRSINNKARAKEILLFIHFLCFIIFVCCYYNLSFLNPMNS